MFQQRLSRFLTATVCCYQSDIQIEDPSQSRGIYFRVSNQEIYEQNVEEYDEGGCFQGDIESRA